MIEYLVLVGVFSIMFLLAFLPGYLEYRAPRDPGPLFIDLARVIEPRSEAMSLRRIVESLADNQGWIRVPEAERPVWFGETLMLEKVLKNKQGSLKVWRVDGNMIVPAASTVESALIVLGDFESREHCRFSEWVYVKGRCQIGPRNELAAIVSEGDLLIGEESDILNFVDSDGTIRIKAGCVIRGCVSSGKATIVEGSCDVNRINSPVIQMISRRGD